MTQEIINKLKSFINSKHCTLLGVGVISKNVVDSAIELANEYNIPLMLIASRRQIEAKKFGGGYVDNCTTETFARYVRDKDKGNNIILCRDHGGLWQNNFEIEQNFTLHEAMESAKESFRVDIESGFEILHIDTSIDIHENINTNESLSRIFGLYSYCCSIAKQLGKEILFEIGSEEQNPDGKNTDIEYVISKTQKFCEINSLPYPSFVVVQTGTKVLETQNIGMFDEIFGHSLVIPKESEIPHLLEMCNKYSIFLKEHNTDYLSDRSLQWHPKLGIHASNVAPEFGVVETKIFIQILEIYKLYDIVNEFLKLSYESKKWEKWMMPDSTTTDREKATISGHYVFSDPRFIDLKNVAIKELKKYNIDLDKELKIQIKNSMMRYLINFNMI